VTGLRRLAPALALAVIAACAPPKVQVGPALPVVALAKVCLGPEHRNHYDYAVNATGWYVLRGHDGDSYPVYLQPNNVLQAAGIDPSDVLWQPGAEWPVESRWLRPSGGHRDSQRSPAPPCAP